MAKNKKPKLTRAELNELGWANKKRKKLTGNTRGSRANQPTFEEKQLQERKTTAPKGPRVIRAIPIYLPSKGTELVSSRLAPVDEAQVAGQATTTDNDNLGRHLSVTDLVVSNGQVVESSTTRSKADKAKAKAERAAAQVDKAPGKPSKPAKPAASKARDSKTTATKDEAPIRISKATLKRLEALGVAPGEEQAFLQAEREAKRAKRAAGSRLTPADRAEREDRRIKSRDYKAGCNTDYTATQAQAEKQLAARGKKRAQSGEDLLKAWESMSW